VDTDTEGLGHFIGYIDHLPVLFGLGQKFTGPFLRGGLFNIKDANNVFLLDNGVLA